MPAIAPIENLKVAQKEGLSINAMLHACLPEARRSARVCTAYASRLTMRKVREEEISEKQNK